MKTNVQRYTMVAVVLHWLTAILLIYMLFWGENLIKAPGGGTPANPNLHVSLGITILILTVARLLWRLFNPPPADLPMPLWQKTIAHLTHWAFYVVIVLIPLSGMASLDRSIAGKHPDFANLSFFGLFTVPHYSLNWFGSMHDLLTKLAIGLLILHVGAALWHQFVEKDNVLQRMSPR